MNSERLSKYIKQQSYKLSLALGEYTLNPSNLGQGGNGVVYAASLGGKEIAIKFLVTDASGNTRKQKLSRFLAEYFNIISLEDTRGIVKYIDYDFLKFSDDQGDLEIPAIIMKKYNGSLANSKKSISKEGFISLFTFLIDTVEKIHKEGIIHRDIKPENILVDGESFVLADFGIASFNPEMFSIKAITKKSDRIANRLFSAPEQEEPGVESHETMDIYAIGQVLQWYVTGKTHRGTGRQTIKSVFNDLSIYDEIIDSCLKNNPLHRPQFIHEIKSMLRPESESKLNPSQLMNLFSNICVKNFPKTKSDFAYTNSIERIDRFFESFQQKQVEFGSSLWRLDGVGSCDFFLIKKGEGKWKFKDSEFNIHELWVHHNLSAFNDFILVHYLPSEPFFIDGEESYFSVHVDNQYYITYDEYANGFAEINDTVVDLSNHFVELTSRQEEGGYFFIAPLSNCVLQWRNNDKVYEFIEKINSKANVEIIKDLAVFKEEIKKHLHPEILEHL